MRTLRTVAVAILLTAAAARADTLEIQSLSTADDGDAANWMAFTCERNRASMSCTTLQTLISTKVKPAEVQQEIEKQLAAFNADPTSGFGPKDCAEFDDGLAKVSRLTPNPDGTVRGLDGKTVKASSLRLVREMLGSMQAVCRSNNSETRRRLVELTVRSDAKTCRVITLWNKATFNLDLNTGNWIASQGPTGPCGVINVSTLENDASVAVKPPNDLFWTYTTKRIVTNPSGSYVGGSCSAMEQHTFRYNWRKTSTPMECDVIGPGL